MSKAEKIGAVVMSRLMGGTFNIRNLYDEKYENVTVVLDLHEGDRLVWRYVIADNVPVLPSLTDIHAKTRADYDDEINDAYDRAIAGDEKLFAKGKLMEEYRD